MSIVLLGSTSGSCTLQEQAVAGTTVLTLPTTSGTVATLTTPSFATTIGVGGATPSTSGAGITFPATQSASTDANTLDDYEEGTWTASLLCGSGTITLKTANQTGVYTKIGRVVNVSGYFEVNSISSPSGRLRVSGLPFVQANSDCVAVGICYLLTTNAYTGVPWCIGEGGNSYVYIDRNAGTGADPAVDLASAIRATTEFFVNFTYTTS